MKKATATILCMLAVLNLTACNLFGNESSSSSEQSGSSSLAPQSSSGSASGSPAVPEVTVEGDMVTVTLPAYLFKQASDFQLEGINSEDITKNPDGSYTIVLDKAKYAEQFEYYRENINTTFDEISKNFTSIKSISADDDFSVITIVADQEAFEKGLDAFAIVGVSMGALAYQAFIGVPEDEMDVLVNMENSTTGEVFLSKHYPEAFG